MAKMAVVLLTHFRWTAAVSAALGDKYITFPVTAYSKSQLSAFNVN